MSSILMGHFGRYRSIIISGVPNRVYSDDADIFRIDIPVLGERIIKLGDSF